MITSLAEYMRRFCDAQKLGRCQFVSDVEIKVAAVRI